MKTISVYICIILALFCLSSFTECKRKNTRLEFQEAFSNVDNIFVPVDMDSPTGANIYVTSIFGQVYKFANNDAVLQSAVSEWFNIYQATSINFFSNAADGGDEGLTSIEFHPSYPTVPKFYAFYTSSNTSIQVTAFSVFYNGSVNYASADVLITIPKPLAKSIVQPYGILYEAYLGGDLRFHIENQEGDDDDDCGGCEDDEDNGCKANLYIATGYGYDNTAAQNNSNLLGKILRITPRTSGTGYIIPSSNPRVSTFGPPGLVYARGLRNPRKMYFAEDPANLFVGDVGDAYDEIDVIRKSKNYGWGVVEGCTNNGLYANPIYAYTDANAPHTITQGPYYDGAIKAIRERMLFADLYSGQLYAIQSSAVGSSCGAQPFAVAKVENALISSILVVGDDVIVCNVIGAAYGLPTFFRLVEVQV